MKALAMGIIACFIVSSLASAAKNPYAGKKLIEYGWDVPDTAFVRAHIAEMEKVPFDGVVIRVFAKPGSGDQLGWRTFSKQRIKPEEYEHAIADLKATKFKRFTDNFIQVIAYPGDVDWFDPDWSAVAHNAGCLARIAKLSGCRGIMFDPEHYSEHLVWKYKAQPAGRTFEEYAEKIKECGKEFIRAINKEYPNITILTLYGPSLPYLQSRPGGLEAADYGLLMSFYDGMCEAATSGTIIVDGYESSYGYRKPMLFEDGRKTVLESARAISTEQSAFRKHIRCGFGVWADFNSANIPWNPTDFTKNYWTPEELRASLAYALGSSDGYVWVYSERLKWWDFDVPKPYVDALALAKTGPGPAPAQSRTFDLPPPRAADQRNYKDEEAFADLRKQMTEIFDFPKDGWRFKRDESGVGRKQGWYRVDFDDSSWRTISIGKFWEEQGEVEYNGRAWYRLKFKAPAVEPGRRIFLAVGAADESAWAWLNGKSVGAHDIGPVGWEDAFAVEVRGALKPDQENTLAVLVYDREGAGGLWKSVKLMVKK